MSKKKLISVILSISMLMPTIFSTGIAAATSGDFEYDVLDDGTVAITEYIGNGGDVVIPEEINGHAVTRIDNYSFDGCTGIVSVAIPNSVTNIGYFAFESCTGLSSLIIPDSVICIESSAFSGCSGLTDVVIPNSVTTIEGCAFSGCTGLTGVILPESVEQVAGDAFSGCSNLTSIEVQNGNLNYSSENGVLFSKDKTVLVAYPCGKSGSYSIPRSVTEIGENAFASSSLTDVVVQDAVTTIGRYAFFGCESLASITIQDGVAKIDSYAFSFCTSLQDITLPNSVTSIGYYAFYNCTNLESISLPNAIERIDHYTFARCSGLKSIIIPDSVKEIGSFVFDQCSSLSEVKLPGSVSLIDYAAFMRCSGLTSIEIPSSVTSIEPCLFYECTGLVNITIPDSVSTIGEMAFWKCTSLSSAVVPDSVVQIDGSAFDGCTGLTIYGNEGSYAEAYASEYSISFALVGGSYVDTSAVFADVKSDGWYKTAVDYAVANGLMTGKSDSKFAPGENMNRAMLVTVLYRLEGEPAVSGATPFTDLKQDWYKPAVAWAYENGIVEGTSATTFAPTKDITREQMAKILYAYTAYKGHDVSETADLSKYPDGADTHDWAQTELAWANAVELISGTTKNGATILSPRGNATRAQVATILMRYCEKY